MNNPHAPIPAQKKRSSGLQWTVGALTVSASFLPCPECGLPVAVHAWPYLLLWLVRGLVKRRTVRSCNLIRGESEAILQEEVTQIDKNKKCP